MIFGKLAEASGADQIKSCCVFTVPDCPDNCQNGKRARDQFSLDTASRLSSLLRAEGFRVTDSKPASGRGAAFEIKFDEFDVVVVLISTREGSVVEGNVLTWCLRPIWRRVSPTLVSEGWIRACTAIEKTLRQDMKTASLQLLTEKEADTHWELKAKS